MNFGYVRVAAAIPNVKIADCAYNTTQIANLMRKAGEKHVEAIVFPELSITGYTCGDLFFQTALLDSAESSLKALLETTSDLDMLGIVGMPIAIHGRLANAAVAFQHGNILGIVPKTYLPNYKEFYEKRWFASALQLKEQEIDICGQTVPFGTNLLFATKHFSFGIEICEDLWATIPPSSRIALNGADIIFNLSADNELVGKHEYLCQLISQQAARCISGYVFASSGFGESTTDAVFSGNAIVNENGCMLAQSERFSFEEQLVVADIDVEKIHNERQCNTTFAESCNQYADATKTIHAQIAEHALHADLYRTIEPYPFVPESDKRDERCEEIFSIQTSALAQRLLHTRAQTAVVGISGGLDSTLALLVCVRAFDKLNWDRSKILAVTMPGFGTTDRTYENAINLAHYLKVTLREVSIKQACLQHFSDIGHDANVHDVVYENAQARERTQVLMDIANQTAGLVIGTGDLSELALGWATYNGDHMSMYGVNAGIPKTLVKYLVAWFADAHADQETRKTLTDIIATPISPELIPADENGMIKQKTEDLVGPYELHDFFLFNMLRNGFAPDKIYFLACKAFKNEFSEATIKKWLATFMRRFFNQQFKRSCMPDGPKVGMSLSPRGDWRMPSDATARLWLDMCNNL